MATLTDILAKARRVVMRRGVSDDDADELVHDAFLKLERYERAHDVQSREALLIKAAVNLSIDRARRQRRSPIAEYDNLFDIPDNLPDPAQIVEERMRLARAAEGLERLPERSRRILLKRRLDNMAFADIARSEGMSVAAVEKQVARATLQLVKWMEQW
ncbi:RNA polymerase sigma factor [Sphingopyxis sp. MWB1]|uniref:RNA polymerase sigma factor n=1 Tax=Sphingopyxis sp. MWB1 TaxID=1537715 RepID=UPI000519F32D|nr:sigma-70 family RNA polymerase sigma factor [Sphingopyxis sp. MWB1]